VKSLAITGPDEKYSLVWRERYGFVRMAAQHGYNITPFGLVGPDDWFDHAIEGKDLLNTLIPKPQRCYLSIGEPIQVPDCRGKTVTKAIQKSVRAETADKVESLIADMLLLRAQQKQDEGWLRRLLTR
jgi:1-acyl-sn-glycerol-3-phosphate acyltransferase